jgi:hypothetical protein
MTKGTINQPEIFPTRSFNESIKRQKLFILLNPSTDSGKRLPIFLLFYPAR